MAADTTPKIPKRLVLTVGELPKPGTLPDPYPNEILEPNQQGFSARSGVPWLSQHFRVLVMNLRGNGRFDRPTAQADYSFDHYYADFVAVLDTLKVDRTAVVWISATTMTAIRLAHEQPNRVLRLISAGGWETTSARMSIPPANAWETRVGTLRAKPVSTTCRLFFALRTTDEVMALNFLVFTELMKTEHYDIVVGDEVWEVDTRFDGEPQLGGGVAAAPI